MQINLEKKHIIIIAIVLAVVAYLLWKRHKSSETGGDTGGPEKSELDAILDEVGASASLKSYVRSIAKSIEKDPKWKQSIKDKADDNGYTYAQQVVLDAIYMKYTDSEGNWKEKTPWGLIGKVKDL